MELLYDLLRILSYGIIAGVAFGIVGFCFIMYLLWDFEGPLRKGEK